MQGVSRYANVQKAAPKPAAVETQTDKVDVSASSRSFETALQAVKDAPEVRMDRVQELQEQINNGSYKVDARAVAEKILSEI